MKNHLIDKQKSNKNNIFIIFGLLIILSLVIFFTIKNNIQPLSTGNLKIITSKGTYNLNVEIANTPSSKEKGLMNRKSMDENQGMIFVFENEQIQNFWMKDTLIPLDMIFFDANKNFVSITENAQPCLNMGSNCVTYPSSGPAKYVVEVNGGWSKDKSIDNKTTLIFE